jgi:hypothetical protein
MKCNHCEDRCDKCRARLTDENFAFDSGRIVQIIAPRQRVRAVYLYGDGSTGEFDVDLIALDEQGTVSFLESDDNGSFEEPNRAHNFLGYWFKPGPIPEDWLTHRKEHLAEERQREAEWSERRSREVQSRGL